MYHHFSQSYFPVKENPSPVLFCSFLLQAIGSSSFDAVRDPDVGRESCLKNRHNLCIAKVVCRQPTCVRQQNLI